MSNKSSGIKEITHAVERETLAAKNFSSPLSVKEDPLIMRPASKGSVVQSYKYNGSPSSFLFSERLQP